MHLAEVEAKYESKDLESNGDPETDMELFNVSADTFGDHISVIQAAKALWHLGA